jgi:N-acetylmuramoyl-L-alanine amidase
VTALLQPDSALVAELAPSPNLGDRRGKPIDALILHYTGMATGAGALARLTDSSSGVSCHYLVWEDGRIVQLVAEAARAWHAGRSFWAGEDDMNSVSIGIEMVNGGSIGGSPPYPAAQVDAVAALAKDICRRRGIAPHRVLGHSDIAPDRKDDPGAWFPWPVLAAKGVGLWFDPPPPDPAPHLAPGATGDAVRRLQAMLAHIGYGCPVTGHFDVTTEAAITAFQRHWRPARVDGRLDSSTQTAMAAAWDIIPRR